MSEPVKIFSKSLSGNGSKVLRPINNQILVERAGDVHQYGTILAVVGESSVDVNVSTVASVADSAKVETADGRLKVGDRVLSVRVVSKKVDDIDLRSPSGSKFGFLPDEHILAVLTDEKILPCNDCVLVEAHGDRRQYESIVLLGADSLDVHSSKILAMGPQVQQVNVGEYAIHPHRFGVTLDSFELRKKYGGNLKIIREKSLLGASADVSVDGYHYPEIIPTKKLF